jgi:formylglycine-generating enzyme required for sulfatase activity
MMSVMAARKGRRVALAAGAVALVVIAVAAVLGWPRILSWYRFMQVFESLGRNAQGYPEYRHRQTGIDFVLLPGGKFLMGAQRTDPTEPNYDPDAENDEGPVHEVTVRPYLIAKYEVTQAHWKTIMGSNPSYFKGKVDRPVEGFSWEYVQKFKAKTGLHLPTEAQWEFACRGRTSTPYSGTGKLDDMGWCKENSGGTTHPVGTKAPNGFGIYDMHGNVAEWCEDVYDKDFYQKPEAGQNDPRADVESEKRVTRGGCWIDFKRCRSSCRGAFSHMSPGFDIGLGIRPVAP